MEQIQIIAYLIAGCSLLMVLLVMLLDWQTRKRMEEIHRQEIELQEMRVREAQMQSNVRIYMQRYIDLQAEILTAKKRLEQEKPKFTERDAKTRELYQQALHYQRFSECAELANNRLNNFFRKLHTDYPELSEAQQLLLLFFLLGIKSEDIAILMHFQESSVPNTKARLARKLGLTSSTLLRAKLEEILCKE